MTSVTLNHFSPACQYGIYITTVLLPEQSLLPRSGCHVLLTLDYAHLVKIFELWMNGGIWHIQLVRNVLTGHGRWSVSMQESYDQFLIGNDRDLAVELDGYLRHLHHFPANHLGHVRGPNHIQIFVRIFLVGRTLELRTVVLAV